MECILPGYYYILARRRRGAEFFFISCLSSAPPCPAIALATADAPCLPRHSSVERRRVRENCFSLPISPLRIHFKPPRSRRFQGLHMNIHIIIHFGF